MIAISLLDFIRTGCFGTVDGPITRSELLQRLGEPDDFGCGPCRSKAGIWRYGDIEFHFSSKRSDATLCLVFSDGFDIPRGGTKIELDPWIICRKLKQVELESALHKLGLSFETVVPDYDESQCLILVEPGITLGFIKEDDDLPYMFTISQQLERAEQNNSEQV